MMQTASPTRDRWIPWSFVGFFVLLVLADGVFVTLALTSWPGLETEQAFVQGLAHDQALVAARAQVARDERASLVVTPDGEQVRVEFRLTDRFGRALAGADARVSFKRPTQAALDFEFALSEYAPGAYRGTAALPARGQWDVHVLVARDAGDFVLHERVLLR